MVKVIDRVYDQQGHPCSVFATEQSKDYIPSKKGIGICGLNALTNFMGVVIWTDIQQFLVTVAKAKGVKVNDEIEQYQ